MVSVEDHFPTTGLYSSLCEIVVRNHLDAEVVALGPLSATFEVGNTPDYYHKIFGLDSDAIVKRFKN